MTNDFHAGRRRFLNQSAGATAGLALGPWLTAAAADGAPRAFDLALQGYSLKQLDRPALLAFAATAGIPHLELYDPQLPLPIDQAERRRIAEAFAASGVTLAATYTDKFTGERERNARILDAGEALGVGLFSCRPDQGALLALNDQIAGREVAIALHNTSPYPGKSFVYLQEMEVALNQLTRIDACVDIGNFARAGEDPVEAVRRLQGRIREVHIKDVAADGSDAALGEGTLDLPAIIKQLHRQAFAGLVTLERTGGSTELPARKQDIARHFGRLRRLAEGGR